jgi:plasmid stabilization system protein ParE
VVFYTYDDDSVTIPRMLHERRHVTPELLLPEGES